MDVLSFINMNNKSYRYLNMLRETDNPFFSYTSQKIFKDSHTIEDNEDDREENTD